MKLKRNLVLGILFFLSINMIFGEEKKESAGNITVGVLNGPSCIPAAYLMEKSPEFNYEKFADPQALLPKLLKREIDVGFLPLNIAAKVYNSSGKKITCLAVTGNGNLSIITKDKKLHKFSQLKGKTVYVAGRGATPEYIFKYLISQNEMNLSGNDAVNIEYSIPTANLAASLISDKIEYALVPEPFSTIALLKDNNVREAINIQSEYEDVMSKGSVYPLTVLVCNSDIVKKNPEKIEAFLEKYKNAFEWTIKNPSISARYCEKHQLGLSASVVEKAIPKSNFTFKTASKARTECETLLTIFMEYDSKSIGEALPDSDFYY